MKLACGSAATNSPASIRSPPWRCGDQAPAGGALDLGEVVEPVGADQLQEDGIAQACGRHEADRALPREADERVGEAGFAQSPPLSAST